MSRCTLWLTKKHHLSALRPYSRRDHHRVGSGRDARVLLADLPCSADSESMELIVDQINASAERKGGGESLDYSSLLLVEC